MNRRCLLPLILVLALICVPMIPFDSEGDVGGKVGGVVYSHFDDEQSITINESCKASLSFCNKNTDSVLVIVSQPTDSEIKLVGGAGEYPLSASDDKVITIEFKPDRNAHLQKYDVEIQITVCNSKTHSEEKATTTFPISVSSINSNAQYYNKILGIIDNPFPSPFNEPLSTATITLCIWVLISLVAVFVAQLIIRIGMRDQISDRDRVDKQVRIPVFICVMMFAIVNCLRIYGFNDSFISTVNFVANLLYIPLVSYIAWKVYKAIIWRVLNDLEKKTGNQYIYEATSPLLQTIGKILIVVIAVATLLSTLGLNLAVIITGAGIAGLAISLGTKTAFNEFFSGLTVLVTRPFKVGDTIKVEGHDDEMKVVNVGILRTEFVNRYNVDHFVVPNSTLASSKIINFTRKTKAYRMFVYVDVNIDEDLELIKKLLLEIAYNEPDVITDGSYSKPSIRINNVKDGRVNVRLSVFIRDVGKKHYIHGKLREAILQRFRENDISAPIPRVDITYIDRGDRE